MSSRTLPTALAALAASGAVALTLGGLTPASVGAGGLAALWAVALVAALIGAPIAAAEARAEAARGGPALPRAFAEASTTLLLTVAAAAALAAACAPLGAWASIPTLVAWLAAALLGPRAAAVGIGLAILAAIGLGVVAAVSGPVGWTALEPGWGAWRAWLAPAALSGALVAGVGVGARARGHNPSRAGLASVGLGALALTAAAVAWAGAYELDFTLAPVGIGLAIPVALGASAPLLVATRGDLPRVHAVIGLAVSALLLGPASEGSALLWSSLLPVGMALVLGLRAAGVGGRDRALLGLGALGCCAIATFSWPGLPGVGAAGALGLLPALFAWVAGTRAVAARSA